MKKGFTVEEHIKLGLKAKILYNMSVTFCTQLGNAYPLADEKSVLSNKIYKYMMKIKSLLEEDLYNKHKSSANTYFYYGDMKKEQEDLLDEVFEEIKNDLYRR